ncbi:MAG TPA: HAD hydrolase-like protein [Candidatus Binatia bacterium]|nr:HAD hydrolase-like protein [Candidatus Binatia bacterium]
MSTRPGVVYEHVAFDLDGTLVDSGDDLAAAVNHVLVTLGRPPIAPATVRRYVGDGARVLVERTLGADGEALVPRALEIFLAYYGAHLLDATRPYPGIPAALAALAARGVALSVLTNKPVAMSRAILDGVGLGRCFVEVVGGDSLPVRKPDPAGLEHLRVRTGTARERMLLVGDSAIDVRTAAAANVAFCGVAWGLAPEALHAARPARVIESPERLVDVVERG